MEELDLPRVAVIALAKREEEVFVPGSSVADPARAAQRRAPAPAAHPRRGPPRRASLSPPEAGHEVDGDDLRRPAGRRARRGGARSCATSARPSGSSRRRRRSSKASRACRRRPRARSTRSCTRPGRRSARGLPRAPTWSRPPVERASRALFITPRKLRCPSVSTIAVNPATTFVPRRISRTPTLNARSCAPGTAPPNT